VKVLVDDPRKAVAYQAVWDGKDEKGKRVPAGVYLLRLEARESRTIKQAVLVR